MSFSKKNFFLADLHKSTNLESENLQEFFKVSQYFNSLVCFEGHILMAPQYLFLFYNCGVNSEKKLNVCIKKIICKAGTCIVECCKK